MNILTRISLPIILLMSTTSPGADELGRLFFTPEQRARLEYDKLQSGQPGDNRHVLMVNGIVQRHGGERTVWINGVPQYTGASNEKMPESVSVAIPGQSQPAKVKVGQKVLINPAAETGQ